MCDADNAAPLFSKEAFGRTYRIVRCRRCGLVYTNPRYGNSRRIYSETYFTSKGEYPGRDFLEERAYADAQSRLKWNLKRIEDIKRRKGRLLDIGSAMGTFLALARSSGWSTFGVEISDYAAEYASNNLGLNIFCGELSQANFEISSFDVVTMHHVLEHIANPYLFLRDQVEPILKTGGLLEVSTPNFGSLEAKLMKARFEDLRPEQHLYHFTPASLKNVVQAAGFEVIRIETYMDKLTVSGLLRSFGISPRCPWASKDVGRTMPSNRSAHLVSRGKLVAEKAIRPLSAPWRYYLAQSRQSKSLAIYAVKR